MWATADERLALLQLLVCGTLSRRRAQATAFEALAELPWTRATGRRDEIGLVPARRQELVSLLDRVWPEWGETLTELTAHGLPVTPRGFGQLCDRRRAGGLPPLPDRINRRTAAALSAPHSKSTLTASRLASLGDVAATHDGSVRLRPPAGLVARVGDEQIDVGEIAAVLGEVAIPERAFLQGLRLEGPVRAVLLVENLGAWRDMVAPPGWLLAHVPGWDTATAMHLLDRLADVPMLHFGDLDPNGARIFAHLKARRPTLRWFVPDFWTELLPTHARQAAWPEDIAIGDAPALVRGLVRTARWMEQEAIAMDPRIEEALEEAIAAGPLAGSR